ncbi:MAG: CHAD domain-containing protein [Rhodospirillaceae bacterium]|nr:CHAD domain-containing protein [Rhodospirillaceae bacterium]
MKGFSSWTGARSEPKYSGTTIQEATISERLTSSTTLGPSATPPVKAPKRSRRLATARRAPRAPIAAILKVEPVRHAPESTVDAALGAILGAARHHWTKNEAAARDGRDIEGVHQVRVGLRRFRSALGLLKKFIPAHQYAWLKSEAKWLLGELGQARDSDVFLAELLPSVRKAMGNRRALAALDRAARTFRDQAQIRARAALSSKRYARFMQRLDTWLAGEGWRAARDEAVKDGSHLDARPFATRALDKRLGKLRSRGKRIDTLPVDDLHRLRIEIKKVRYGIDCFQSILNKRRAGKYAATLKGLQDELGHLNDVAMAEAMATRLAGNAPEKTRAAVVEGGGMVVAHHRRAAAAAMPDLARKWRSFRKLDPL